MLRSMLFILLFAMLVSGCSSFSPTPVATPGPPEVDVSWTLRMDHSGGIMGLSRSIEISSDGKFTVSDERDNSTVEGQLSANELATLRDLLNSLKDIQVPATGRTTCADCFVYAIEFKDDGKSFRAELDDTTLADSGLEPLVTFVRGIMEKALQ